MRSPKLRLAFGLVTIVLLASSATTPVLSADARSDGISADQILQKLKEQYASLTSYSDEGRIVVTMNESTALSFTMRLARTNFYRVEWNESGEPAYPAGNAGFQAVWSSGAGDHAVDQGRAVFVPGDRETALAHAAAYTGGEAATIPRIFFNPTGGASDEPGGGVAANARQQPDEKLGDLDCYVFSSELLGQTNTLWIGKQDFLIHQLRTGISARGVQLRMDRAGGGTDLTGLFPELQPPAFIVTETHTNIVLNRPFSRADFVPSVPLFRACEP